MKEKYEKYPLVTGIGCIIHTLGLFDFIPHPACIIHFSMLLIDLFVFYALTNKTNWGYVLALILYMQQSMMQTYWAYKKYTCDFYSTSFGIFSSTHSGRIMFTYSYMA